MRLPPKEKPPRIWLYTRCPDCGVQLGVTEVQIPDNVIAKHIMRDCIRHAHPPKVLRRHNRERRPE